MLIIYLHHQNMLPPLALLLVGYLSYINDKLMKNLKKPI
ncbi:hypothetical protein C427_3427 [Paraglaciecola psychrophila 170]|uniref:Uncharacterized protein n=1 Tax=Paraglaciecola psychrophila 170 TaxID=1129794 RepID=K7A791_9ALTE|nr:hypothetical protein C427_3427 [Paraglaciecola psychrophila 170]GAC38197.1 hypothetical protein GPSY_2583 [Paraglaciecola psychrophila 170]